MYAGIRRQTQEAWIGCTSSRFVTRSRIFKHARSNKKDGVSRLKHSTTDRSWSELAQRQPSQIIPSTEAIRYHTFWICTWRTHCAGYAALTTHYSPTQGLIIGTPAASKGALSRDATIKPRAAAIAAMYPSGVGKPRPLALANTASSA